MTDPSEIYLDRPTTEEIDDVLAQGVSGALGTINDDGTVHISFVIFLRDGDRFYCETSSVTRKARNVASRPTATLAVQGTASSGRHLMVAMEGDCRVVTGDEAHALNRRLRAKYIRPEALDAIDRAWGRFDDVALEITARRWRSWTGTAMHEATQVELGDIPYDDVWLSD